MGKAESKGQVAALTSKLDAAYATIKRMEADLHKAQRRLREKSLEVGEATRARKEALTLLQQALAEDSSLREKVAQLLADDAQREVEIGREAAFVAAQMTIPDERLEA
jgi:hypothetical protein